MPTAEEYQDACSIRPFNFEEATPQPWDEATEQTRLKDEIRLETTRSNREPPSYFFLILAIPAATMLATLGIAFAVTQDAILRACALIITTGVSALITRRVLSSKWQRHIDALVNQNFASRWPQRKSKLNEEHSKAVAAYEARRRGAEKEWLIAEQERSAWAKRLVDGDIEALEDAITDTVGDLDFPFEANCDVAILEDRSVCLHLDLPEIEDVIPETRGQVLKDGRVRQVKRTLTERNGDYAHLVTGLALYLANEVFVVSPTLHTVKIAAYTQRKKRGTQEEMDAYVYDITLLRNQAAHVDFAGIEPVSWATSTATAFEQQSNLALKALSRPLWTSDFTDE